MEVATHGEEGGGRREGTKGGTHCSQGKWGGTQDKCGGGTSKSRIPFGRNNEGTYEWQGIKMKGLNVVATSLMRGNTRAKGDGNDHDK